MTIITCHDVRVCRPYEEHDVIRRVCAALAIVVLSFSILDAATNFPSTPKMVAATATSRPVKAQALTVAPVQVETATEDVVPIIPVISARPNADGAPSVVIKHESDAPGTIRDLLIGFFSILLSVLSVLVSTRLLPWLKRRTEAADADRQRSEIDSIGLVKRQLKQFLWGVAFTTTEKEFPKLAEDILAGRVKTVEGVKGRMRTWGEALYHQAVDQFKMQGMDLESIFGRDYLWSLIERVSNVVSPFPGQETARTLIEGDGAKHIEKYGVDYTRRLYKFRPPGAVVGIPDTLDPADIASEPETTAQTPDGFPAASGGDRGGEV